MHLSHFRYAILFFAGFFCCNYAFASHEELEKEIRGLNNVAVGLLAQVESGGPASVQSQGAAALEKRSARLYDLIKKDPGKALALGFSADVLKRFATAFPESARLLEQQGTWRGSNTCIMIDDPTMTKRQVVHRLTVGNEDLDVNFAGPDPQGLRSGVILEVKGIRLKERVAGVGNVQGPSAEAATCNTKGVQNSVVLLITFPGVTPPSGVTTQVVSDAFFGSSGRTVDSYWREASYDQASATGSVHGWYTLDRVYTCDEYYAMRALLCLQVGLQISPRVRSH